jgi:hypothetical protein
MSQQEFLSSSQQDDFPTIRHLLRAFPRFAALGTGIVAHIAAMSWELNPYGNSVAAGLGLIAAALAFGLSAIGTRQQ